MQLTAAQRIMAGGRTEPLTAVEKAFFGIPDHMVKPHSEERVPIMVESGARVRLLRVLNHDARFRAIGYSEFINRALDALGCEG